MTLRLGSSPIDWVATSGLSRRARWIQRRSRADIGSSWSILPVSPTRSAARRAISTQLPFAAAAVVLDVDEHARPVAHPPGEHQVDQVLERREALALAADQRAERFASRRPRRSR